MNNKKFNVSSLLYKLLFIISVCSVIAIIIGRVVENRNILVYGFCVFSACVTMFSLTKVPNPKLHLDKFKIYNDFDEFYKHVNNNDNESEDN